MRLRLCRADEIRKKRSRVFALPDDRQMVVWRTRRGYVGMENRCPHAGAPLDGGRLKREELTCLWHGWRFDLESGACLTPGGAPLTLIPLRIEEGDLIAELPDTDTDQPTGNPS